MDPLIPILTTLKVANEVYAERKRDEAEYVSDDHYEALQRAAALDISKHDWSSNSCWRMLVIYWCLTHTHDVVWLVGYDQLQGYSVRCSAFGNKVILEHFRDGEFQYAWIGCEKGYRRL